MTTRIHICLSNYINYCLRIYALVCICRYYCDYCDTYLTHDSVRHICLHKCFLYFQSFEKFALERWTYFCVVTTLRFINISVSYLSMQNLFVIANLEIFFILFGQSLYLTIMKIHDWPCLTLALGIVNWSFLLT